MNTTLPLPLSCHHHHPIRSQYQVATLTISLLQYDMIMVFNQPPPAALLGVFPLTPMHQLTAPETTAMNTKVCTATDERHQSSIRI